MITALVRCLPVVQDLRSKRMNEDYIKRKDAIKAVNHLQEVFHLSSNELEFGIILKDVFRDEIPSADVEPVIRCKDCKYKEDCHKITLINQKTLSGKNIVAQHYPYLSYPVPYPKRNMDDESSFPRQLSMYN